MVLDVVSTPWITLMIRRRFDLLGGYYGREYGTTDAG